MFSSQGRRGRVLRPLLLLSYQSAAHSGIFKERGVPARSFCFVTPPVKS